MKQNDLVSHPSYGEGRVSRTYADKSVDVIFSDGERNVHYDDLVYAREAAAVAASKPRQFDPRKEFLIEHSMSRYFAAVFNFEPEYADLAGHTTSWTRQNTNPAIYQKAKEWLASEPEFVAICRALLADNPQGVFSIQNAVERFRWEPETTAEVIAGLKTQALKRKQSAFEAAIA